MNLQQIQAIRGSNTVAAVVSTRNATFWIVDQEGRPAGQPGSTARYELVEWDDVNGLCVLRTLNLPNSNQFGTKVYVNYDIIDELITLDQ